MLVKPVTYRIVRADRASSPAEIGDKVYEGRDYCGSADMDSRGSGMRRVAVSRYMRGVPYFTIPAADVQQVVDV